jgi:putative sterol carrier protein
MGHAFLSTSWAAAYKDAINANPRYATAGKDWTHGAVAMVVRADERIGITADMAVLLDLHAGVCRDATYVTAQAARETAPFVLEGGYDNWKTLIVQNEDPIAALMQGKLSLTKGRMLTIVRYMESSKQLLASAQSVPTEFDR